MDRRKKAVILFPGQGSIKGARDLDILKTSYARELDKKASVIFGYSLIEKIVSADEKDFSKTTFAQPAGFFLGLLSYVILKEEKDLYFVAACGHSLGELTALTASGFFDIQTGFLLVQQRARLMEACCRRELTGMLAVIGDNPLSLSEISEKFGVYLANINSKKQVVFAGLVENLKNFREEVQKIGYKTVYLPVEGAFHTSFMDEASTKFRLFLSNQKIGYGTFPVISNVDGEPYTKENLVKKLSTQISSPVRFTDCLENASKYNPEYWIEAFPGNVLLKFLPEEFKGEKIPFRNLEDIDKL